MIKVKLTYKNLQEKEKVLNALEKIFIVKNISKEYSRDKGTDIYAELEFKSS